MLLSRDYVGYMAGEFVKGLGFGHLGRHQALHQLACHVSDVIARQQHFLTALRETLKNQCTVRCKPCQENDSVSGGFLLVTPAGPFYRWPVYLRLTAKHGSRLRCRDT